VGQALDVHRLHFAFTITFHYIFPQLTMGLALLLVYLKTKALRTGDEHYNRAARFWGRIFGINFAVGVITGIPMEFQFGTNWAAFSKAAGGVIGQTLAMEGVFSFFLESSFLGLFLIGEKNKASIIAANLREKTISTIPGVENELLQKERNIKYNIARLDVQSDQAKDNKVLESLASEKEKYEIELSRLQKNFEKNNHYYNSSTIMIFRG